MRQPTQSGLVTCLVMAGFLSALICQSHMVGEADGASAHHDATHEGASSHHGTPDREDTSADPCCVIQAADVKVADSIALAPHLVDVVFVDTDVQGSCTDLAIAERTLTHKPPGGLSLLQQTCAFLI